MTAYRMESERKRRRPDACRCEDTPSQVADDGFSARHTAHFSNNGNGIVELKMVKHLGRHDYVNALVLEWKPKCISSSDDVVGLAIFPDQRKRQIESNRPQVEAKFFRCDFCGRGYVAPARTHVEHGYGSNRCLCTNDLSTYSPKRRSQLLHRRAR